MPATSSSGAGSSRDLRSDRIQDFWPPWRAADRKEYMMSVNPYRKTANAAPTRVRPARKTASSRREEQIYDQSGEYNPMAFGGKTASGRVQASSERMFDKHGQVNAWDKADALRQAAHLLQNVV